VDLLVSDPDGVYVDATVGGGGHSRLIFERLSAHGTLIGCDRDTDAIARSKEVLPERVILLRCRFSEIRMKASAHIGKGLAGMLMDLGVSSYQLDTASRGFSHRFSGALDLRMDPSAGETAAELVARLDAAGLAQLIWDYGEDSQARRIAKAIVASRERQPIITTDELANVIARSVPATRVKSQTRVFQALRIAVNHELEELEQGLADAWELLRPGGRLVVISYHSLEDRMVKNFMRSKATPPEEGTPLPFMPPPKPLGRLLVKKPLVPDEIELELNPRSRSARLRAIEKIV
jgi:16S rRNA (cytosine1402-N4)-methyltransferase